MQDSYNQPLVRGRTKTSQQHSRYIASRVYKEFILFGDNLLECLAVLNPAIEQYDLWTFQYIVYEPIDQPVYVFEAKSGHVIVIKACGNYSNWALPRSVSELVFRYDLPDVVLFNVSDNKVVLAGEFTETASVGNSQWQRELRKIAAAELGIPFVYQTVYSGKDDGQDTIREPTSLLAYNAFLYSIRYKTPSLVVFIETNIEASRGRIRKEALSPSTISRWFCAYMLSESSEDIAVHKEIEIQIYRSMAGYLKEPKLSELRKGGSESRLQQDLPCISPAVKSALLDKPDQFAAELSDYLHGEATGQDVFLAKHDFSDLMKSKMKPWTDKKSTDFISEMFEFFEANGLSQPIAPLSKFAAGIVDTSDLVKFLKSSALNWSKDVERVLSQQSETVVIPIYFHKLSNGKPQFTKDPYAGNTAAFGELLGYGQLGQKKRSVLAYCVSSNPVGFDLHSKKDTNIYRSVAKYCDVLLLDTKELVVKFEPHQKVHPSNSIKSIAEVAPMYLTEDMGVTTTYLQLGVVGSDWDACMIAIHHSSWQQIRIRDEDNKITTVKIPRNSSKVDLVMQSPENIFLMAEGKRSYEDFFRSPQEIEKITAAFTNTREIIDSLYRDETTRKITAFVCLIDIPDVITDDHMRRERKKISDSIAAGDLDSIAADEFVVIGCYTQNGVTKFELFFSKRFPSVDRNSLTALFN
jgi:hypothetical protein